MRNRQKGEKPAYFFEVESAAAVRQEAMQAVLAEESMGVVKNGHYYSVQHLPILSRLGH